MDPVRTVCGALGLVHLERVISQGADVTAAHCTRCDRWWKLRASRAHGDHELVAEHER